MDRDHVRTPLAEDKPMRTQWSGVLRLARFPIERARNAVDAWHLTGRIFGGMSKFRDIQSVQGTAKTTGLIA